MKKKLTRFTLMGIILVIVLSSGSLVAYAASYDKAKAIAYAEKNWGSGSSLCAGFVSECLKAGGIIIPNTAYSSSTKSYNGISGTLGSFNNPQIASAAQLLWFSKNGYQIIKNPSNSQIALGDIVFMNSPSGYPDGHVAIVIKKATDGTPTWAAHNNYTKTGTFSNSRPCTYVVKMPLPAPSKPDGGKAVKASSTTVTISWNAASNATSYEVQYRTQNSGGWKTDPDYKTKTSKSYVSTGLNSNYTYQYRVRAVNSTGTSGWLYIYYSKTGNFYPYPNGGDMALSANTSWKTIAYSNKGFNCDVLVASLGGNADIRMLDKSGNVVWSENGAIRANRFFWCGSNVYTIQIRRQSGTGNAYAHE